MMGRSMGADSQTVEKPADLAPQLEAAIASGRPTVLDVRIDREIRPLGYRELGSSANSSSDAELRLGEDE